MLFTNFAILLTLVSAGKQHNEPQFTPHKTDGMVMDCDLQGTKWTEFWFNTDARRPEFRGSTIVTATEGHNGAVRVAGTNVNFPEMIAFETVPNASGHRSQKVYPPTTFQIKVDPATHKQQLVINRDGVAETHDFFPLMEEGNDPTFEGDTKNTKCQFTGYVPNLTFTI